MTDNDLIKRLRSLVVLDEVGSDNPLGRDAADAIERLVAELEAARAVLKMLEGDQCPSPS